MACSTVPVTKIQRFSTHDGPGVRTTVFLKGCPLRCQWCHNPETQSFRPEIFYTEKECIGCGACEAACPAGAHRFLENGHTFEKQSCTGCGACAAICPAGACEMCAREMTVPEIIKEALRDRAFYGETGGLTLSGGEPMAHPEEALALLRAAKDEGMHTAIETSGFFPEKYIFPLSEVTDLFLWDIKDTNPERHRQYTGVEPDRIIQNLKALNALCANIRLRLIMVKGVNMEPNHYAGVCALIKSLPSVAGADLLPYHPYGGSKARQLGWPDNGNPAWVPSGEDMEAAYAYFRREGINV